MPNPLPFLLTCCWRGYARPLMLLCDSCGCYFGWGYSLRQCGAGCYFADLLEALLLNTFEAAAATRLLVTSGFLVIFALPFEPFVRPVDVGRSGSKNQVVAFVICFIVFPASPNAKIFSLVFDPHFILSFSLFHKYFFFCRYGRQ